MCRVTRRHPLGRLGEGRDELVVDPGRHQHAGGGRAVLAGIEEPGAGDALGCLLDVRVVEDDDRRLAAELEVDPLEVGGRGSCHLHAGAHRARDRHHLRSGVLDQRAAGVPVTADHVEDPRRQELAAELGQQRGAGRGGVAGLEHDGVAGSQRRGDLPDHHQQRVVPRRDLTDDADRLAAYPRGVVGHVLTRRTTLQHPRGAGEEPEVVRGVRHLLGHGEPLRLAGVETLDPIDLLDAGVDRIGDLQHRGGSVLRGGLTPRLERRRRSPVGAVHVLGTRPRRGRVGLPGRRVDDVVGLAGGSGHPLAVDDVLEGRVSHDADPSARPTDSVGGTTFGNGIG